MRPRRYTQSETNSNLNVGQLLQRVIQEKKLVKSLVARKTQRKPTGFQQFIKQKSTQASILWELCHAMRHNLFADLAQELPKEFTRLHPEDTSKDEEIARLRHRIEILEAQLEVLKR